MIQDGRPDRAIHRICMFLSRGSSCVCSRCWAASMARRGLLSDPSYHDVHVTTASIPRTSLFDLPYGYELVCGRVVGWTLDFNRSEVVAGEYDGPEKWLVVDVAGHVILDSRRAGDAP